MNILKRLFCKHKYITVTNIYGDSINNYGARSFKKCEACGKTKFFKELDKECLVSNWGVNFDYLKEYNPEYLKWYFKKMESIGYYKRYKVNLND